MKKIINGKRYDTESAQLLAEWDNGYGTNDFKYCAENLYRKKTGEYFLYGEGGALTIYAEDRGNMKCDGESIMPVSAEGARDWVEAHCDGDKYEEIFGEVEEPDLGEASELLSILVPASIYTALRERKKSTGTTITAQIISLLRGAGY